MTKKFKDFIKENEDIDKILDKINRSGIKSLTNIEKSVLDGQATSQDIENKTKFHSKGMDMFGIGKELKVDHETSIHDNVGRLVRIIPNKASGIYATLPLIYEIVGIQKIWDQKTGRVDKLGYRICTLGKQSIMSPQNPEECLFVEISDAEAIEINHELLRSWKSSVDYENYIKSLYKKYKWKYAINDKGQFIPTL